jgi:hypothetical protein
LFGSGGDGESYVDIALPHSLTSLSRGHHFLYAFDFAR